MSLNKGKCISVLLVLKKQWIFQKQKRYDKTLNYETLCHFLCPTAGQN